MMGKNDSRQGSLFVDGDLPSVERTTMADKQISGSLREVRGEDFHMRIQRHPAPQGLFRRTWRRLIGER
ncbi:hypothetical protein [Sphingomonas sp.]|uniref:hypothetical protein n=1 Tax=Sphingomonas sp. TaxID=28214 RepID=UPI0025D7E555|nr:hypothetical protein [Sphingomonas sp.]